VLRLVGALDFLRAHSCSSDIHPIRSFATRRPRHVWSDIQLSVSLGSQRFTNDTASGNEGDGGKFRELTPVFFGFGFASRLVISTAGTGHISGEHAEQVTLLNRHRRKLSLNVLRLRRASLKWQGINDVDEKSGLLFITSENVGNCHLRKLDDLKYVESRFRDIEPRSMLKRGDLLINLVGTSIGRTVLYELDVEESISQAVGIIRLVEIPIGPNIRYPLDYLNSKAAIELMLGMRVTTAQPNMSLTDVKEFPVPLPPLAEQHRIVTTVNELNALCDELESSLTTTDTTRKQLLESILSDSLSNNK
jgi:hypothetical protein